MKRKAKGDERQEAEGWKREGRRGKGRMMDGIMRGCIGLTYMTRGCIV